MGVSAALPAAASAAGAGFTVPSRNTTCAVMSASAMRPLGMDAGLYCTSSYIKRGSYDGQGAVRLGPSARARTVASGNDLLLVIGGYDLRDETVTRRGVLPYGRTFRSGGYSCTSRSTGLSCRRGAHGFFLSRERQSYR
jgi:hypothetical protein